MGISEEFNSIEFDDDIDYKYVREYLDLIGFNLCDQKREAITTVSRLKRLKFLAGILKSMGLRYSPKYYQDYIDLCNRHDKLCDQFYGYNDSLRDIVTKDNYGEVYKLAYFMEVKYCSNFDHLVECRSEVEAAYNNRIPFSSNTVDDRESVDEFFRERISKLRKGFQKVKK